MECNKCGFRYELYLYWKNTTAVENASKAVVRKVSYTTEDGREVLQDTNNSSVDFKASVRATFIACPITKRPRMRLRFLTLLTIACLLPIRIWAADTLHIEQKLLSEYNHTALFRKQIWRE